MLIKASVHQECVIIISIYIPNCRLAKFMKQNLTELKRKTDSSAITGGDFNTLFSTIGRT